MIIQKLTDADYAAVLSLYTELDRVHYETRPDYFGKRDCSFPKDVYLETLAAPECLMLGAFEEDVLCGIVSVTIWNKSGMIQGIKTACLDNIYVLPEFRGKGIAKALFSEAEKWAKQQGAIRLDLHVWAFNENALALYKAMGMDFQYHVMEKKL